MMMLVVVGGLLFFCHVLLQGDNQMDLFDKKEQSFKMQFNIYTPKHMDAHVNLSIDPSIDRVAAMGDRSERSVRNFLQESLDFDENAAASDCTIRGAFCILLALLSL